MKNRQIVNVINFIRGVEPRAKIDLKEPVREQIRLMKEHRLRGTFLLQYDALIDPEYIEMLKPLDKEQFEIGVWFETVKPQVEKAGIEWTGRFPWDWHVHCGFSLGYTKEQREKLVDVLYEEFFRVFGYYPRVFGSWLFDSHTLRYVSDRYGLDAACDCKEQYGTDGYTLWGGYYGQGYYPSRKNVFMPAQSADDQLPAPVFRMLGSDPVYQYDFGMSADGGATAWQGVVTLEPVYAGGGYGGGEPKWVDWYFKENFNGECLSFGYAQAGQENSFGWPRMKDGLTYQFEQLEKLQNEGKITVEPLGETGRWYQRTYSETPASAISAHSAFDDAEKESLWYSTSVYRVNLYSDHGNLRVRDLHVFSPNLPDPYEDAVCEGNCAAYETLPAIDGNRFSGNGVIAGAYFARADGTPVQAGKMRFADLGDGKARADFGEIRALLKRDALRFESSGEFTLENRIGKDGGCKPETLLKDDQTVLFTYKNVKYALFAEKGRFLSPEKAVSENGVLEIRILPRA